MFGGEFKLKQRVSSVAIQRIAENSCRGEIIPAPRRGQRGASLAILRMEAVRSQESSLRFRGSVQTKRCWQRLLLASFVCILALISISANFRVQCQEETSLEPTELSSIYSTPDDALDSRPKKEPDVANSNSKLKPVNFTLVEEIFESVLSDDEVVRRWKIMDAQLQEGMRAILKMIFPQIVSISQDAKVSGDCSGGILKWILSLRNLRSWAIKMLDATGKPTSGIFEGSLTMFGNYRQCLSIRAPDEDEIEITDQFEEYFRGQFCVLHLKPWMPAKRPFYNLNSTIEPLLRKNYKYYEKTLYDELAEIAIAFNFVDIRMDLCVPSTCTVADIQRVADLLSKKLEMRAKVMRCDIAPRDSSLFNQLDRVSILWLIVPLTLICISLIATIFVMLLPSPDKGSANLNKSNPSRSCGQKFATILRCLSIVEALKDLLESPTNRKTSANDEYPDESSGFGEQENGRQSSSISGRKPLALYGLRNLFIFWFIIVQMTVELKYQYLRESLVLRHMIISYWPLQIIVNSVLIFESLILITAFTFGYSCLEANLKDLVGYVIEKCARLIPSIATMIALTIITPLAGIESPVWRNFVDDQSAICKSTGYLDLFFLQNFIPYEKICLPHTWLFCVELQLTILSIPLVLLLKKNFLSTEDALIMRAEGELSKRGNPLTVAFTRMLYSRAGVIGLFLLLTGSLINFFSVYGNQLPASWFNTFPDVAQRNYYFGHYLTKTWTHLGVFIVGLLAGHLCRSTIQLRHIESLKSRQSSQDATQQPSPAPSCSTQPSQDRHGSTSTIMAMDLGARIPDESSSVAQTSSSGDTRKEESRSQPGMALQLAALICMCAVLFSTFSWSTSDGPSNLVAALYDAGSRLLWSMALVAIMMQLCLPNAHTNRYSWTASVLGHPICSFLGRLSFLAYLISPYVHTFILAVEEQSLFPSLFIIFHVIVGNIVITYVAAFLLAIVIEMPLRRLIGRFVLGRRFCRQRITVSTYYTNTSGSMPTILLPTKPTS